MAEALASSSSHNFWNEMLIDHVLNDLLMLPLLMAFVGKKILLMSFLARFRVFCPLLTRSPVIVFFVN